MDAQMQAAIDAAIPADEAAPDVAPVEAADTAEVADEAIPDGLTAELDAMKAKPGTEPEKKPEETPAAQPSESAKFVALARMEKQLREEKAKREALEKGQPAPLTEENFWEEVAKRGLDPQKLIYRLAEKKEPPKPKTEAELRAEKLEQEVAELRKKTLEREESEKQARAQAAAAQGKSSIRETVTKAAEKFPFLNSRLDDVAETVWEAMTIKFNEDGTVLDLDSKLAELEAHYEKQAEEFAAVLTKKKGTPTIPSSNRSHQQTASGRPPASGPKTLTNRAAATSAPPARKSRPSDEELEAEAAAAIRFVP